MQIIHKHSTTQQTQSDLATESDGERCRLNLVSSSTGSWTAVRVLCNRWESSLENWRPCSGTHRVFTSTPTLSACSWTMCIILWLLHRNGELRHINNYIIVTTSTTSYTYIWQSFKQWANINPHRTATRSDVYLYGQRCAASFGLNLELIYSQQTWA